MLQIIPVKLPEQLQPIGMLQIIPCTMAHKLKHSNRAKNWWISNKVFKICNSIWYLIVIFKTKHFVESDWSHCAFHHSVLYNMTEWPGWKSLCIHHSVQYNMTGWPGWKSSCIHQSVQYNMTGWPGWKSSCIHQSVQYNMTGWPGWKSLCIHQSVQYNMTGWPGWKSLCIHQSVQYNMTGWPGWKSLCIHQSVQYNMTGWLGWRLMGWWQWQSGLKLSMEPLSSLEGMRAWLSDFDVKCIRFSFRLWYQSINVAIWYFKLKKVLGFFFANQQFYLTFFFGGGGGGICVVGVSETVISQDCLMGCWVCLAPS